MDLSHTPSVKARAFSAAAGLGLLATLSAASGPAHAAKFVTSMAPTTGQNCAIQLTIDNPLPGADLYKGSYMVYGVARDLRVAQGTGIVSVRTFLGDRDQGGIEETQATFPDPAPLGFFSVKLDLPQNSSGPTALYFYAMTATGEEAVIGLPILLNQNPSDYVKTTGSQIPKDVMVSCPVVLGSTPAAAGTSQAGSSGQAAPTGGMMAPAPAAAPKPVSMDFFLGISNPNDGDVVNQGSSLSVGGAAYDPKAASGVGVTRVQVYFDNRDSGGFFLGEAVPSRPSGRPTPSAQFANAGFDIPITLPQNLAGQHTLYVYALSSVTGQETVGTVFINIQQRK